MDSNYNNEIAITLTIDIKYNNSDIGTVTVVRLSSFTFAPPMVTNSHGFCPDYGVSIYEMASGHKVIPLVSNLLKSLR